MSGHKNRSRASVHPFDVATMALTVGGLGFLRPAPGTWGSVPPVLILGAMMSAGVSPTGLHMTAVALLILASAACVYWGVYAETRFGRKDAAEVVADETAGVCLPLMAGLTVTSEQLQPLAVFLAAFVLFRLFDIAKPWPMRRLERLPGGWGVLTDDLMAGVYAALALLAGAGLWTRYF